MRRLAHFWCSKAPTHAQARGARPRARISAIASDRNRRREGEIEATLVREWDTIAAERELARK